MVRFEYSNCLEPVINKLQPYVHNPQFTKAAMEKISVAAASLCSWVTAMETYFWASKAVAPLKTKLAEARKQLEQRNQSLNAAKSKQQEMEDEIASLSQRCDTYYTKRQALYQEVADCQAKLLRATKLITGIGGEQVLWEERLAEFEQKYAGLIGDILLLSGFIVYLGPLTQYYRVSLLDKWKTKLKELGIEVSKGFSIQDALSDPLQIRSWNLQGLMDNQSVQNAILVKESSRYHCLIHALTECK